MLKWILETVVLGIIIYFVAQFLPGFGVASIKSGILAAGLISIANSTLGFLLRIISFPLNIITFGLISFIISILMIMLVDKMLGTFSVAGFWFAALLAIIITVVRSVFFRDRGKID